MTSLLINYIRNCLLKNLTEGIYGSNDFMNHWKEFPFEAGMAYLCKNDYRATKRCFELAEKNHCIVTKSIGEPGRYLHLVFIDYCKAMLSGVTWSDDLAANGFPVDSI